MYSIMEGADDTKSIFIKEEHKDEFEFVDFTTQSDATPLVIGDQSQDVHDFDASIKIEEHGVQVLKEDISEETTTKEIETVFLPEQPFKKALRLNEPSTSGTQSKIQKQRKTSNVCIKMNRSEFVKCCVGLVTVKNIPFRIFDDEQFFKELILPYEEQFNIDINSKNIVEKLNIVSDKITEVISSSVCNKMICLKLDLASRMDKSVLGINIQYIKDFEICVNTIGMIQLKKKLTAQFLTDEILNCINKFDINIRQLYSITTDNAPNVLKTSQSLQELEEYIQTPSDMDTDYIDNEYEEIHHRLTGVFAAVRCAAHTIQLAAQDVLETIRPNIEKCKNAIKTLWVRTTQGGKINITMPVIDNITNRWNSIFDMINSLSKLRGSIDDTDDKLRIPDVDWNFVTEFIEAFQPLVDCTKRFQSEQYIVGDFYRDILCCEVELEELINKNTYASKLTEALKTRKKMLLNDDAFISAIFLDPRFNFQNSPFFTEDEKRIAINHLLKSYNIIKPLAGESQDLVYHHNNYSSSRKFSKLEHMVNSLMDTITSRSTDKNMKQTLENLVYTERVPFETKILEYWRHMYHRDPELGNLIQVALAVPSTQESVERAFTALTVVLSHNCSKLSQQTIDNLLLVKLNSHLLTEITLQD